MGQWAVGGGLGANLANFFANNNRNGFGIGALGGLSGAALTSAVVEILRAANDCGCEGKK